jgi:hypothetical protein
MIEKSPLVNKSNSDLLSHNSSSEISTASSTNKNIEIKKEYSSDEVY